MKKFNLELALAGHPVITRGGKKVLLLHHFPNIELDQQIRAILEDGNIHDYYDNGCYYHENINLDDDLFLEDIDWQPEPKMGDMVEVLSGKTWEDRIFIKYGRNGSIICVMKSNERHYRLGESFDTGEWDKAKWRRKQLSPEIEITVKINGKEAKLSDISDETLQMLKNL